MVIVLPIIEERKESVCDVIGTKCSELCIYYCYSDNKISQAHLISFQKICEKEYFIKVADGCSQVTDHGYTNTLTLNKTHKGSIMKQRYETWLLCNNMIFTVVIDRPLIML